MSLKELLLCSVVGVSITPALAQTEDPDDDVIVVEGTRLNQTLNEVGSSVSVIGPDDLRELDFDFVLDAIASVPGVTINQTGPFGGQASVRIRGAASEQTLVLIDGVPVNDASTPGGGYDFARLDTENIERIDILKGPQSVLWGSDAIGGVVSIITKSPEEGVGGSLFGEYGSFNTYRGGGSAQASGDVGSLRIGAVGVSSNGISKADESNGNTEQDAYDSMTLLASGGLNLPADIRLDANVLWTDATAEFDSFVFGDQGNVGDGDEVNETEELNTNATLRAPLFGGRLQNLVQVGYSDIDRQNFSGGAPSFGAEGERTILRYQGTAEVNDANTLAFGVERDETSVDGDGITIDSVFGLYEFKPIAGLTLTGGIRVDDHETFGSETTGRLAAAYNPTETITLRASWGQGFKAPTLFQLSGGGFVAPNPDLQPETSEGFDLGAEWRSQDGGAFVGLTIFNQDIENLIDFTFEGYRNVRLAETSGIEAVAGYQFTPWLTVQGNYTFLDAEDGDGNELARLPEHTGEVRATLDPDGPFSGAVIVRYNGEEANTDGTTLDGWTRVDLTARYALSDRVELFGRAENLLDEDYQQVLGYGTPGLSGSVGLRLTY